MNKTTTKNSNKKHNNHIKNWRKEVNQRDVSRGVCSEVEQVVLEEAEAEDLPVVEAVDPGVSYSTRQTSEYLLAR